MNTVNEILKQRRLELNLTMLDVAKAVGVSEGTVSRWENGGIANMRRDRIAALAKVLQISPAVIMGWTDTKAAFSKELNYFGSKFHKIPILGQIAAGLPIYAEQNIEGYTVTDLNGRSEYFALRVKGDSMTAAYIKDKSIIIVRQQAEVENGEIAVVMVNDENATVKRFKRDGNIVMLSPQSYNPEHETQIYDLRTDTIKVLGKVVKCIIDF